LEERARGRLDGVAKAHEMVSERITAKARGCVGCGTTLARRDGR